MNETVSITGKEIVFTGKGKVYSFSLIPPFTTNPSNGA
jgi:hypothetical protein